ncbi:protein TALPID3 isoform X3 [Scleropages formosus]|uniref:protein TALPID3 isoform X3 n=1 Tax=Scleropages formosus TaxID=113540 RepID=UPI0010FA846A|nr:protein TALPID3 isoform X3 [Scleropages formosus]
MAARPTFSSGPPETRRKSHPPPRASRCGDAGHVSLARTRGASGEFQPVANSLSGASQSANMEGAPHHLCELDEKSISQVHNRRDLRARECSFPLGGSTHTEHDVVISEYASGGKEAIRSILKQRLHCTPSRQKVKVQLLAGEAAFCPEDRPSTEEPQYGTAGLAAVVSATLAATAPIFKAQSDVEARVSRLSERLRRLQEAGEHQDRGLGCRDNCSLKRVTHLEEQLSVLTQHNLQHLERMQEQQLELQNHLISSTLDALNAHPRVEAPPSTMDMCRQGQWEPSGTALSAADVPRGGRAGGGGRSSPETLAAHRFVPISMSRDSRTQEDGEHLPSGNGSHVEEILDDPTYERRATVPEGGQMVTMATVGCQPGTSRPRPQRCTGSLSTSRARDLPALAPGTPTTRALAPTDQRANGANQDLRDTSSEVQVRQPEEASSGLQTAVLLKSRPPPSVLENARKDFQAARHRKKVLDENLDAMRRARDQEAFYSLLDSISSSRDLSEKIRIRRTVDAWMWLSRKGMRNTPSETKCVKEAEEYLKNIYGKDPCKSNESTQKTSPYFRSTSHSQKSRSLKPRVVERVKDITMQLRHSNTHARLHKQHAERQHTFTRSQGECSDLQEPHRPLEGFAIPVAIPLCKPRVYDMGRQPSRVHTARPPTAVAQSPVHKASVTLLEVSSKRRGPSQLQVQVLPSVNIDGVSSGSPLVSPSPPPTPSTKAVQQTPVEPQQEEEEEEEEEEDEDNVFPGTDFLAVADIPQEPLVQLNGIGEPPAPLYHGPVHDPEHQAQDTPAAVDPCLDAIQQRKCLESQLVEWVEQQVMARMITELSSPPDQNDPASFSEEEESSASISDIVDAAGRRSLHAEIVRQYVDEALAETVALFLGQREVQSPAPPASLRADVAMQECALFQEPVVRTPVPTPAPSATESPVCGILWSPLVTPEASEKECVPPGVLAGDELILMTTPHTTPDASPRLLGTPNLPRTLCSSEPVNLDAEPWPLEEETRPGGNEELQQQLVMSVERDEESLSLIYPSPSILPEPQPPASHSPRQETPPPRATPSTESSSSTLSITETDMLGRHISEGELVMSYGQMAAVRGLVEEGLVLPKLSGSLSSSLQGVQDMEYDPPSEGQVPLRPPVLALQDTVLTLSDKMNKGRAKRQEEEEEEEDEALCAGESSSLDLSEEQKPSVEQHISSPGQVSLPPGSRTFSCVTGHDGTESAPIPPASRNGGSASMGVMRGVADSSGSSDL